MRVFYGPGPSAFIEQGEVAAHLDEEDVHVILTGLNLVPAHSSYRSRADDLMKRLKETL